MQKQSSGNTASETSQLESELKQFLIDTLALEHVTADAIDSDLPLFGEGLGLDSVDALELAVALQKKYGVAIDPKDEQTVHYMRCVRNLAAFVALHAS